MKKYIWLIAILLLLIVAGFILKLTYNFVIQSRVNIEKALALLTEEFTPIKMKLSLSDEQINFQLKFYDQQNNNIAAYNDSITGNRLFVDFYIVKIEGKNLFFPYLVYSDIVPPSMGKKIYESYEKNFDGILFPGIYSSDNMDDNFMNFILQVWKAIKSGNIDFFSTQYHGNAVHLLNDIDRIDPNSVYSFICHTEKGGIEIVQQ
ncbi:MAG TPA: hypothetical protein PK520_02725 [Exilispira sp.]|nr:hypothetical protein [Exilispira sp.]HNV44264.1 hypothetical protein [Exilispira sp.]HPB47437.1 hypothetical protein [Exilispira sp.]HQQ18983.1 hypothetical protein [Exilispira sp.]